MELSKRLAAVAALVPEGGCVADVGTDHGYMPIFLVEQGIVKKAAFSSIDFQLSNGLYINAPVGLKFTDFSPFSIKVASNKKPALCLRQQISQKQLKK